MNENLILVTFIFISVFTGITGLLLIYVESYLPTFITRSYRYGKFSTSAYQPIIAKTEVPKRWFKHFYIFAAPASSCILYLALCKYLWKVDVPKSILWLLDICLGKSRKPQVSPECTVVAAMLLTLHIWKRLYETQCVSIYSNKMMHVGHYIVGFVHYAGSILCLIGESKGFVDGSQGNFSWSRITYFHLLCAIIIILSSLTQLKANCILSDLRKNKDNKINSTIYKIPHGSLFDYVSGALQTTEIIIYLMLSLLLWQSCTFHYVTIWVLVNQIATAVLTHKWYIETFPNYPKSRKILIPCIF